MTIERVKGFRDIFAPQSLKREKIRRILEDKAKLFGFMPVETPTIEYDEILKGENENDEAVSDRFKLKDKGNRSDSSLFRRSTSSSISPSFGGGGGGGFGGFGGGSFGGGGASRGF